MAIRIGIDAGGTFTDVTGYDPAQARIILSRKYSSNPADPAAVMAQIVDDLLREFGPSGVDLIMHGSTAALNTLLEDKGVRTGLLTTAGFRDIYEIGRQWRGDDVFNLFTPAPKMLLPRDRIHEISERLDKSGAPITPLDVAGVGTAVRALLAANVDAIAVCFLFAYANPVHEIQAAEIIRRLAPHVFVSLSSSVNPEWREYERTASTIANAYIGPPVLKYLEGLEALVRKAFPACRALMMKSDGGAASARMLHEAPIQTVMSGPVAGVIGARYLGDAKQITNLITFDAGGTSSDMAVLPGEPLMKSEVRIARHPVRTQSVDIETIGAGGGSIASIELGRVLKVGPASAGALPGPACYDRGGSFATLTDALVVLGHLNNASLLEGGMAISAQKARDAISANVAEPLAISIEEAASGVLTVLTANCTSAMRTITVERGYDPRDFTLLPFGGMGPAIASHIARELGVNKILVPADPGTFSAWGMLVTGIRQERAITALTPLDSTTPAELEARFVQLEHEALQGLAEENIDRTRITTQRHAAMRYRGQSYEVPVLAGPFATAEDIAHLSESFHAAHKRRYGHMASQESIEIVNFKAVATADLGNPQLQRAPRAPGETSRPASRNAWFDNRWIQTPVWRRSALTPGQIITGPAIIEEPTSTLVINPQDSASVDEFGNIEITIAPAQAQT